MKKKKQRPVSDSDSSSSSESDSDSDSASSSTENCKYKKSKAKKSGIVSKPTDKVKNPQSFPHNYLQFEYVNKDLKFKQLNFKQLVAGELEIISHFCKNEAEKEGRLKLLQKISYYASVYQWSSILDFYAAWLRQIEIGKKSWKDDPQVLESAILLPSEISYLQILELVQKHLSKVKILNLIFGFVTNFKETSVKKKSLLILLLSVVPLRRYITFALLVSKKMVLKKITQNVRINVLIKQND